MIETPIRQIAKWIPDALYPCSGCSGKNGFDELCYPADDLLVLGDRVFCRGCIELAESLANLLSVQNNSNTDLLIDLSFEERKVLDKTPSPMYGCRSCKDDPYESVFPTYPVQQLQWYEGDYFGGVGFFCLDCLSDRSIEDDKRGPILSKVIEWDEERMRKSREEYKKRKNK